MNLKILSSIIFLLPSLNAYAEATVIEKPHVCQQRIDAFKSTLEASIKAKQNVEVAKSELDQINKLPKNLSPCEKEKQIPALANADETSKQADEALKDRKISP